MSVPGQVPSNALPIRGGHPELSGQQKVMVHWESTSASRVKNILEFPSNSGLQLLRAGRTLDFGFWAGPREQREK